ncbi:1-phosphatidylinositol-4,5-bisphosphate phosphodiesterase delta 1 [Cordyceps javanica]|uniref:Phosphoinositide phospholipase C n=1 Tax=Cordyceps javanica TaxID=43265 RepID=A0A545W1X2_9HYPO|nr:1-phosphatidylinositol-4,5-bisphosphate phosphodiesterase delta 1 [Cordyceps javanica]TQW07983.1 1-phosphatidylinositol-4,5-bisphosphate phosphodiesterase delta 1 [Cordyceps javanica]
MASKKQTTMRNSTSPPPSEALDAPEAPGQRFPQARVVESFQPNVMKHLRSIYAVHAGSGSTWTASQTSDFIRNLQKHEQIFDDDGDTPALDLAGFLDYMASSNAAAILPRDNEDLSWPMSAYFISSSHNTYLTGNQLYSDSTTEAYANVLRRGCRCVEIDVWDGTGSDAESSESSSDEEDTTRLGKKESHSQSDRLARLKSSLPEAVASRLSKTGALRRKLERTASHRLTDANKSLTSLRSPSQSSLANEPRVLHGYTLTKEVSFRDVCATIREHAFAASDLPLIISLEVHCNPEQQAIMVDIMKEAWGDVAVVAPPEDQVPAVLPSPGSLRGKILVKVKYAPPNRSHGESGEEEVEGLDRTDSELPVKAAEKKKPSKIIRALSDLGIYTRAVSFKSWAQPEATMPAHIFSLSEKKFTTHHEQNSAKLFEHNRDYMLRAYPSGLRIGSSNLNPPPFWGSGAQIVALNWQQTDEGMMLNQGMFGGTNGYVLKPEGYRPHLAAKPSPNDIIRKTLSLSVTFFAAQYVPLPFGDTSDSGFHPYIKMELHVDGNPSHDLTGNKRTLANQGHERDGDHKAHTKSHRGGADVDFKGQVLSFQGITDVVEELTFLRFKVCDDEIGNDDLAAWACVRLDRLASGYRFIHLWDSKISKASNKTYKYLSERL